MNMTQKRDDRPLRERVSIILMPGPGLATKLVEVEEAGVDHVWVGSGPVTNPDVLMQLAAAAARTSRLKLGTSIIQVSTRHPVFLAQQALGFNLEAPGRLLLGVGPGSPLLAKQAYDIEMKAPLAYLREYVQVLRQALQQGEVHYKGRFFTTDVTLPAAEQIPVLVSALGPAAFRLAGEVADGALPFMCPIPYLLDTALPAMSEGAVAAGRPRPKMVAHVPVALSEDRVAAFQAARQGLGFFGKLPAYRNMFLAAGFAENEIDTVADSFIDRLLVYGSEGKIKDRLLELLAIGIDELVLSFIGVSDGEQESARLTRLIGQL
jgi:F420-dependent oxidoreductase-like protein